jgi:hypothetical protein
MRRTKTSLTSPLKERAMAEKVFDYRRFFEDAVYLANRRGRSCACGGELQMVWLTSEDEPEETWHHYIECGNCHTEFGMTLRFETCNIPQGA